MKKKIAIILSICMVMSMTFASFSVTLDRFGNPTYAPGSLGTSLDFSNISRGLYYDGNDYYYILEQGEVATDYLLNLRGEIHYFDSDGKMVKDDMVEYESEYYFFDTNGNMLKNTWVTHEEVDPEEKTTETVAYYFGPSGRAYRADGKNGTDMVIKTIDGMKFGFNSDAERLEGYVTASGEELDEDTDYAYLDCEYYFDPSLNYAAATGFVEYNGEVDEDDLERRMGTNEKNDGIVLYFDEKTCRKVHSQMDGAYVSRMIEGDRYLFDDAGIRQFHWGKKASPSGTTNMVSTHKYYNDAYDGYLAKGWFTAVPDKNSILEKNRTKYTNQEEEDFYADSSGKIVRDCIKKIGHYYYCFDADGVVQDYCLVRVKDGKMVASYDIDELNQMDVVLSAADGGKIQPGEKWMYFTDTGESGDDDVETVGAMCPLNKEVELNLSDMTVMFLANSRGGYSSDDVSEPVERSGKYIQNGVVLKPSEGMNYGIVKKEGTYFIVKKNGKRVNSQGAYKDENDYFLLSGDKNGRYLGTFNFKSCRAKVQNADVAKIVWEWQDDDKTKHTGSLDGTLGDTDMSLYRVDSSTDCYLNFKTLGNLY